MEDLELTSRSDQKYLPASFWNDKRVLVTGHTGFKGSWLSLWLQSRGADVIGLSIEPPTTPSLFVEGRVADGMTSLYGDVRDLDRVLEVMRVHRPEVVFHLAAQSLVRTSYEQPVETYATNVMGTVHVLEAMRLVDSVRAGVIVTSDKCYENEESLLWGYRETDPMGGRDPYSNSKGCAELVTSAYRRSFFDGDEDTASLALASVRSGNVIGGGDWALDRLVPDVVRAFSEGRPVRIRQPEAVRPWQHVLDPLSGYLRLAEHLWHCGREFEGGWNFGPADRDARTVRYVVQQMADRWGEGASAVLDDGDHPHEATYLRLDCSKARKLLDWTPRLRLDEAIDWTIEWYRSGHEDADLRALTLEQIQRYDSLLPDPSDHALQERSPARSLHH